MAKRSSRFTNGDIPTTVTQEQLFLKWDKTFKVKFVKPKKNETYPIVVYEHEIAPHGSFGQSNYEPKRVDYITCYAEVGDPCQFCQAGTKIREQHFYRVYSEEHAKVMWVSNTKYVARVINVELDRLGDKFYDNTYELTKFNPPDDYAFITLNKVFKKSKKIKLANTPSPKSVSSIKQILRDKLRNGYNPSGRKPKQDRATYEEHNDDKWLKKQAKKKNKKKGGKKRKNK